MTTLIVGFILLLTAVLIALLVPRLISEIRLRNRARHDYRVARGTQHLKHLEGALSKLEREIQTTQNEIKTLKRELNDLARKRQDALEEALSRYLVTHRLTEVGGIGLRLRQRILRECFRGKLKDLRNVERVSGVGPARRAAIMAWVRAREREFPRLMKEPFPRKKEVQEKYRSKIQPLERRLNQACQDLQEKQAVREPVQAAVDRLRSVRISDFRKALRANSSDQPVPIWYLEGLYPAWESPPDWFTTLISRYGG